MFFVAKMKILLQFTKFLLNYFHTNLTNFQRFM